jgi:hypothetical protein
MDRAFAASLSPIEIITPFYKLLDVSKLSERETLRASEIGTMLASRGIMRPKNKA